MKSWKNLEGKTRIFLEGCESCYDETDIEYCIFHYPIAG